MSRSAKKALLEIPENSPKTTVPVSFLNKVTRCRPATFLKRDFGKGLFSCDICGVFRSSFSLKHVYERLHLGIAILKLSQNFPESN